VEPWTFPSLGTVEQQLRFGAWDFLSGEGDRTAGRRVGSSPGEQHVPCSAVEPPLPSARSRRRTVRQLLAFGCMAAGGGSTWLVRAQANLCSGVKQQQARQHCSAVAQPQGWFWHGYGALSLGRAEAGKGIPRAAARYEQRVRPEHNRRRKSRQQRQGGSNNMGQETPGQARSETASSILQAVCGKARPRTEQTDDRQSCRSAFTGSTRAARRAG
jgi:hypothetical protein